MIINPYPICALALKTLTRYLFYVFHYLREVVMFICVLFIVIKCIVMKHHIELFIIKTVCQMTC